MTLPRSMELEWQREVIEKWLNTPEVPPDARAGLVEMLRGVREEMERLEAACKHFQEHISRRAS
jgi:hypothetical protein